MKDNTMATRTIKTLNAKSPKVISLGLHDDQGLVVKIGGQSFPYKRTCLEEMDVETDFTYRVICPDLTKALKDIEEERNALIDGFESQLRTEFNIQALYPVEGDTYFGLPLDKEIDEAMWMYVGSNEMDNICAVSSQDLANRLLQLQVDNVTALNVLRDKESVLMGIDTSNTVDNSDSVSDFLKRDLVMGLKSFYMTHANPNHAAYVYDDALGHSIFNPERYRILRRMEENFAQLMQEKIVACAPEMIDIDAKKRAVQDTISEQFRPNDRRLRKGFMAPA